MKRAAELLTFAMMLGPLVSALLWAALSVVWWVEPLSEGQAIVLVLLHALSFVAGFVGFATTVSEGPPELP